MLDAGYWMLVEDSRRRREINMSSNNVLNMTMKEQTSPPGVFNTHSDAAVHPTKAQLSICSLCS